MASPLGSLCGRSEPIETCEEYALGRVLPRDFDLDKVKLLRCLRSAPVSRVLKENNSRGMESHERCIACSQQNGIWAECVVSSNDQVRRSTKGSCANCYYNGLASKCSFRTGSSVFPRVDSLIDVIPEYSDFLGVDDVMLDTYEKIYREDLEKIYGKLIVVKRLFNDPSDEVIQFFRRWIPDLGREIPFDSPFYEKVLNSQILDYERKLFGLRLVRKQR